jgi:hypothetical protein
MSFSLSAHAVSHCVQAESGAESFCIAHAEAACLHSESFAALMPPPKAPVRKSTTTEAIARTAATIIKYSSAP